MAQKKTYMPMSSAGIMGYSEDVKEGFHLKPTHVVAASVAIIIIEIMLPIVLK
jgi:preprotein translocase subunit Sec61beta